MKERQRWQPEEDALLRAYVKQYGAKEWNMVAQRMGKPLDRDAKSCLERWKNYLKPGIKKGSLTEEEQNLVISLQAKYGNKWKKIAAEVPGRTAKRLGKWWEVFKEKQLKEKRKERPDFGSETGGISAENGGPAGKYDHILETFAEKYVQPKLCKEGSSAGNHIPGRLITVPPPPAPSLISDAASFLVAAMPDPRLALSETPPLLSLGAPASSKPDVMAAMSSSVSSLPPWMSNNPQPSFPSDKDFFKQHPSAAAPPSCSVSLSLSPPASEQPILSNGSASPDLLLKWVHKENAINGVAAQPFSSLALFCKELEEGRQNWFQHKKEATWRLSRLEQQLESEKARKRREKIDEIEAKIRCLREEEMAYLDKLDIDCREQLISIQRDAELKEAKLMEQWSNKQLKLSKFLEQLGLHHCPDSLKNFTSKDLH